MNYRIIQGYLSKFKKKEEIDAYKLFLLLGLKS